jgi:hypothetical protein
MAFVDTLLQNETLQEQAAQVRPATRVLHICSALASAASFDRVSQKC